MKGEGMTDTKAEAQALDIDRLAVLQVRLQERVEEGIRDLQTHCDLMGETIAALTYLRRGEEIPPGFESRLLEEAKFERLLDGMTGVRESNIAGAMEIEVPA
jgi:hypothetical protein